MLILCVLRLTDLRVMSKDAMPISLLILSKLERINFFSNKFSDDFRGELHVCKIYISKC